MRKKSGLVFRFEDFGDAFLARDLHQLRTIISAQSDEIFEDAGITAPSHCASLMLLLDQNKEAPVMKIADALGYSHQLIMQRIDVLDALGCIEKEQDPADRRRSLVRLTSAGRAQARKIKNALSTIDAGIRHLMNELDVDLRKALREGKAALGECSLKARASAKRRSAPGTKKR